MTDQETQHKVEQIVTALQTAQEDLAAGTRRVRYGLDRVRLLGASGDLSVDTSELKKLSDDLFTATQALWEDILALYRGIRAIP